LRQQLLLASAVVDPEPISIEVHSLREDGFVVASVATGSTRVESPLLPALRLSPADLVPA